MLTIGEKIKQIRVINNLKQSELAKMLYVSEKTISSWENNRTAPDLNMIYKISDYLKTNFYYLISNEYNSDNIDEIEVKLKVDNKEYERIKNIIEKNSEFKGIYNQIDNYYKLANADQEWLRIRKENGKYIFNYKKKLANCHCEKYDVLIDNYNNLNEILLALGTNQIGTIIKKRTRYIYQGKYDISFDEVENIDKFIEIELINKSKNFEKDISDLLNFMKKLKIDLNMIEQNKYIDYIYNKYEGEKNNE